MGAIQQDMMKIFRKPQVDFNCKRFLIIDDISDMRSMFRQMVESYGVREVDTVANGRDALEAMARKQYDVVLCDYNLGDGQDGQQVLEETRQRKLIRFSTVFMMITAENTLQMVMGAVEYQPDDYLSKPFNKHTMRQRLERIIARKSDFEQIERAVRKNNLAEALHLCDERIKNKPRNIAEFWKLKGDLHLQTGELEAAEALYRKVLAERSLPWATMGLAKVFFLQGQYEQARAIFQEIIAENANHMEAHDWLAKTLVKLHEPEAAQAVLEEAVRLSPKAILRQMALGDLALKKKDFATAERSFKKATALGRHSVYKTPSNYAKQARAMSHTRSKKDALRVLKRMRQAFPGDQQAALTAALAEHEIQLAQGPKEDAERAFEQAQSLFDQIGTQVDADLTLEMSKACIRSGDQARGSALIKNLVWNHHEDVELLEQVQDAFSEVGMEEEGRRLISEGRDKVVKLNNQGVRLVQEGQLAEAIRLFEVALEDMPANKTINSNTASVLIKYMECHGRDDHYLCLARKCLDVARGDSSTDASLVRLQERLEKLIKSDAAA